MNETILPADAISMIRERLLAHYDQRRRDLPWRRVRDPYAIWISEVMLQQTRVETVVPYYERWMERFPTVDALARADLDDVLRTWEGLGYYSRARNLHRAASVVCERHNGSVPDSVDALRQLPGVGEYTAGAIASIAYARPEPAVDGNVKRVLARLLDIATPDPRQLRTTAAALVPADRAGDFNQALMELGATICLPSSPRCEQCPIARVCRACHAGTQLDRPARKPRRALPEEHVVALVALNAGRLAVRRRPDHGLLAGLWELPAIAIDLTTVAGTSAADQPAAEVDAIATAAMRIARQAYGRRTIRALPVVSHTFTHKRIHYHPYVASVGAGWSEGGSAFHPLERLGDLAFPVAQRTVIGLLRSAPDSYQKL